MANAELDNAEQPVREQLKKASLQNDSGMMPSAATNEAVNTTAAAKSISKKRSHEEIDGVQTTSNSNHNESHNHTRKRSRDSTADEGEDAGVVTERGAVESKGQETTLREGTTTPEPQHRSIGLTAAEVVASPKTKRSRLQGSDAAADSTVEPVPGTEHTTKPTTSPFGAIGKTIDAPGSAQTSSSAFAASGFSALAKSESSGFGALGKTTGATGGLTSFASKSPEPANGKNADEPKSVFGGALGAKSAFSTPLGGSTNGFGSGFAKSGGLGGGFAGSSGSGFASLAKGGLSSFATGKVAPLGASSKSPKPFGAPAEDDTGDTGDADDGDDSGIRSPLSTDTGEEKRDERFYEQEIETGEEDDDVLFTGRAKLYTWSTLEDGTSKVWKERGLGAVKLNRKRTKESEPSETAATPESSVARLIMRADGSQRVVLNSLITSQIDVSQPGGGPPTRGVLLFMGTTSGSDKLELLQLKLKNQLALELYTKIRELQGKPRLEDVV